MKRILILMVLLAIVSFAQKQGNDNKLPSTTNERELLRTVVDDSTETFRVALIDTSGNRITLNFDGSGNLLTAVSGVTLSADSLVIRPFTSWVVGTKSVTTSASAVASTADAKEVWIFNDNSSGIIYAGPSGVTTSTGVPIYPNTYAIFKMSDIADVYLISTATITARYSKFN